MPDTNTSATRSIVVGVCLCLLAFAILVGYSVVASHQIGRRHAGVAANSLNRAIGGTLTVQRSKPGAGAPPRPGHEDVVDRVLGKRIERHPGMRHHMPESTSTRSTPRSPRSRQGTQNVALHLPTHSDNTIQQNDDIDHESTEGDWDDRDSDREATHRDHVPQGHAYGYWRNRGSNRGPFTAKTESGRSHPSGHAEHGTRHSLERNDDFDDDAGNSHGNGHAYGHYKGEGGSSSSDKSHGGWGAGHSNGHAYGHSKH